MKKPLILLIIAVIAILAFFGVRSQQKAAWQQKFKEDFQSIPQDMSADLQKMQNEAMKIDILTAYPEIVFYLDLKLLKTKTLPPEALKEMQQKKGWMCPAFFDAIQKDLDNASGFETSVFLEQIKNDKITAEFKFRNAFSEALYVERQVLSDCPEYLKAVYNN